MSPCSLAALQCGMHGGRNMMKRQTYLELPCEGSI